jgi:hypothetical protein
VPTAASRHPALALPARGPSPNCPHAHDAKRSITRPSHVPASSTETHPSPRTTASPITHATSDPASPLPRHPCLWRPHPAAPCLHPPEAPFTSQTPPRGKQPTMVVYPPSRALAWLPLAPHLFPWRCLSGHRPNLPTRCTSSPRVRSCHAL